MIFRENNNGKFKSITCSVYNIMPTQHRCFFEVKYGFDMKASIFVPEYFVPNVDLNGDVKWEHGDVKCTIMVSN